jgi:hypothetical protein
VISVQRNGRMIVNVTFLLGLAVIAMMPVRAANLLPYFPQTSAQFVRYSCVSAGASNENTRRKEPSTSKVTNGSTS